MQKRISKEKAIEIILEEIEKGKTFEVVYELILTKSNLSRPTFSDYWTEAKEKHSQRRQRIEQKKEALRVKHELERTQKLLETADGQVDEYDSMVTTLKSELIQNKATAFIFYRGKLITSERPLTENEKTDKQTLIAKLLSQIADIRGIKAASKSDITVKGGIDDLIKTKNAFQYDEQPKDQKEFKPLK